MQSSNRNRMLRAAAFLGVVLVASSCTKARLIGKKDLSAVKLFTVVSIVPSSGSVSGGDIVQIMGTGFVSGMTVTLGGVPCTGLTVIDSLSLTCTTGAGSLGAQTVAIITPNGDSDTSLTYTYLGIMNAKVTRIASGGNAMMSGGVGANTIYMHSSIGAVTHNQTSNITSGGAGASAISVRNGVIGLVSSQN